MKTPVVMYQRWMTKVSYFRLIRVVFSCDCGDQKSFQRSTKNDTDITYRTLLSTGLRLPTSSKNNRFLLFLLHRKLHAIGQCHCHWLIPVDIPSHFNKIVEQYSKFKAG